MTVTKVRSECCHGEDYGPHGGIAVVVAFTGHTDMVDLALRVMAANAPSNIVFCYVGSSDIDAAWAGRVSAVLGERFVYGSHPDAPLRDRWARGVELARMQGSDLVAIAGPDDILSGQFIRFAERCLCNPLNDGITMLAPRSWYLYDASGTGLHLGSAFRLSCPASARRISLGAGRVYSRCLLERVGWRIFETSQGVGRESSSQMLEAEGETYYASTEEAPILTVKGPWADTDDAGKLFVPDNVHIRALSPWEKASILITEFDLTDADLAPVLDYG